MASSQEVGDKAGVASMAVSRGAALADFNLDGQLDLVVVNRWASAQLWRNAMPIHALARTSAEAVSPQP